MNLAIFREYRWILFNSHKNPKMCKCVCLALKTNLLCIAVTLEILIMFRLIGCCHY